MIIVTLIIRKMTYNDYKNRSGAGKLAHTADAAEAFGESTHHDVDISRVHVAMLADAAAGSSCSVVMLCVYNTNKSMKKHTYICKRIK